MLSRAALQMTLAATGEVELGAPSWGNCGTSASQSLGEREMRGVPYCEYRQSVLVSLNLISIYFSKLVSIYEFT